MAAGQIGGQSGRQLRLGQHRGLLRHPFDLGYDRIVKFDHDFVGAEALQKMNKRRKKVTLVWDAQDMARVVSSAWMDGPKYKHFNMPKARYGLYQMDAVLVDGKPAGISLDCGYIANERKIVSLAVVDQDFTATDTEVTVLWGENPVSKKPQVEAHDQTEVKALVAPPPMAHTPATPTASKTVGPEGFPSGPLPKIAPPAHHRADGNGGACA
jgi:glycine cleavage system aminomethyltransferase T